MDVARQTSTTLVRAAGLSSEHHKNINDSIFKLDRHMFAGDFSYYIAK